MHRTASRMILAPFAWNGIGSRCNFRRSWAASIRAAATQPTFEIISSWTRWICYRRIPSMGVLQYEEGRAARAAPVRGERLRWRRVEIASRAKARKRDVSSAGQQNARAEKSKPRMKRGSYADPLGYPTHGVDPFGRVDARFGHSVSGESRGNAQELQVGGSAVRRQLRPVALALNCASAARNQSALGVSGWL